MSDNIPGQFNKTMLNNYFVEFSTQKSVSISQSPILKTKSCVTAENSISRVISNVALIAATHFIPVEIEDIDVRNQIKTLPPETSELYTMV